jgi:hypothetical protein
VITAIQRDFTELQKKVIAVQTQVQVDNPMAKLTIPGDGEPASHKVVIEGAYSEKEENMDLWVVVRPVESPSFHPQPGPIGKEAGMKWSTIAHLGESQSKNIGEEYIIYFVSTAIEGSRVFSNYLENPENVDKWPGLKTLPDGVNAIDSIRVIRK